MTATRLSLPRSLALLIALTGCGDEPPVAADPPTLSSVEMVRVELLTAATTLVQDPLGRVWTLHPDEQLVRVGDSTGTLIRTVGRRGEGPGEFVLPSGMGFHGDTLWVIDQGARRFSWFDTAGRYVRGRRFTIALATPADIRRPRPTGLWHDGSVRGASVPWTNLIARGDITRHAALRLDTAGAVLDTVASWSVANTAWEIGEPADPSGFSAFQPQPFSTTELVTIASTAPWILRVDQADDSAFTVSLRNFDGDTLICRTIRTAPRPVTDEAVDSVVAHFVASVSGRAGAPPPGRAEQLARASLYVPRFAPPVRAAVLGTDGSIWLRHADAEGRARWRILAPDGRDMGTVALPLRFQPMTVTVDGAWGQDQDALDVPYLARYRLTRS